MTDEIEVRLSRETVRRLNDFAVICNEVNSASDGRWLVIGEACRMALAEADATREDALMDAARRDDLTPDEEHVAARDALRAAWAGFAEVDKAREAYEARQAAVAEPEPDDCQYVNAEGKLWVCRVCGAPTIVNIGPHPLARKCSKEFGRFDNVTSREAQAAVAEPEPDPLDFEVCHICGQPSEGAGGMFCSAPHDRAVAEPEPPARPEPELNEYEWAFASMNQPVVPAQWDTRFRMVLAGHLRVGDVILWGDGEWRQIVRVDHERDVRLWSTGLGEFQSVAPAALVAVRTEEGQ